MMGMIQSWWEGGGVCGGGNWGKQQGHIHRWVQGGEVQQVRAGAAVRRSHLALP